MKLSWTEYYRVILTFVYIFLGFFILIRGVAGGYNFIVGVLGILFIMYGMYRFAHILRYLKEKKKGDIL
ncbi:MAG: hypothetical protein AB1633_04915 [Elusimicrobiota bacterium]